MAKIISKFVSVSGMWASFWVALAKALKQRGIVEDDAIAAAFHENSPLITTIANYIAERSAVTVRTFGATFNYDEPLEDKSEGFNHFNDDLTDEHFTKAVRAGNNIKGYAKLVNFGREISPEEVLELLECMGLRPGIPKELADLLRSNRGSELLAECKIVEALGDSWNTIEKELWANTHPRTSVYPVLNLHRHEPNSKYDPTWWFLAFEE